MEVTFRAPAHRSASSARRLTGGWLAWATVAVGLATALGAGGGCTSTVLVKRVELAERPKPPKGRALVFVYRQRSYLGSGATLAVTIDGAPAGLVSNGTYFFAEVPPGEHIVVADFGLQRKSLELETKARRSYYVEVSNGALARIAPEEAEPVLDELWYAIPEPDA